MNHHEKEDDKAHLLMSLEKITNLDSTLSIMKTDSNILGLITFKISEYRKKKEGNERFDSGSFYSCRGGYKMFIRVYPNGFGKA